MPKETEAKIALQTQRFNEPQKRRLVSSANYIDKLLVDIEQILSASTSGGFPKYKNPLAPVQVRVVRDYIKRLRQQIVHVLANLDIQLPEPRFDSSFSIQVTLQFIEVALEEIAPHRLVGYGSVPECLVNPLAGGIQEMKGIVRQMESYLSQRIEADLSSRLLQLQEADVGANFLKVLGDILERYGLVEFRASLSQLVEKIESPTYEIAFFGRVSTGKSSLLNAIMATELLPVGVTPITSVPTRIKNGLSSQLLVWTAEGRFSKYPIEQLAEFVTEAQNPGNEKRVIRLLVEIPLPMLPDEVVLVDTPGLGSLALEGAAETLAYLPRCDLGVVLVDASSNLQADDVATVDALRAAAVPALVVLSKADLIPEGDRRRLLKYTRTQLARQIGIEVDVAFLSSRPELKLFLREWVAHQISPRIADAKRLAQESSRRKARSLGCRILHALEMIAKTSGVRSDRPAGDLKTAETRLRQAASLVENVRDQSFEITDAIRNAGEPALKRLADRAIDLWQQGPASGIDQSWISKTINQFAQIEAERLASLIQDEARELTIALETAASILSTGGREERFSFDDFVKDMPTAEFTSPLAAIEKPWLLSLSAGLARRSLRSALEKRLGSSIVEFFELYGHTLDVWTRGVLDHLAGEFETHADIYRAQLQRLTGASSQTETPAERVLEDVSFLKHELDLEGPEHEMDTAAAIIA
ncbi:MAG TPA: dynamin family protein [Bryobacteraceae bacterium]|nr:dynamin family protein [Bryobacteraceae bacterium]